MFNIKRNDIIESTLNRLSTPNLNLKIPLKIKFEGEQGVDEGGVIREFFSLLNQKLFVVDFGMFVPKNNNRYLWFNCKSFEIPIYYELMGKLLGLAIYNQVLLDLNFPLVLYKKLQKEPVCLTDLKELDPDLYKGLETLRTFEGDIASTFCLTF